MGLISSLGNTPAVCRKCYIHPALLEAYATGTLAPFIGALENGTREVGIAAVEGVLVRFLSGRTESAA